MTEAKRWSTEQLGRLATIRRGITYSADMLVDRSQGVPYVNMKSFVKGGGYNRSGLKYFNGPHLPDDLVGENDLLVVNTDVTPGGDIVGCATSLPLDLRNRPVVFSHHVTRLRLNKGVDTDYLYYLLNTDVYRRMMLKYARGTTVLMLDMDGIKKVPIRYHSSSIDQAKVTSILNTIDQTIEKTEALIKKYQQIKAGLMHDLFTRGIGDDGKLRPPREQAPELYQKTAIGWIPKEWKVQTISECGEVKLGRQRSPDQHSGKWTTPYLRVANVFDGYFKFDDVLEMDFTPNERAMFSVRSGDILLNEGQSLELVGRSALYQGDDNEYCFQNTLVRFRCNSLHDPMFFAHLFKSYLDTGVFMSIASQTTSVAHLGADRFSRLQCFIPPYFEQQAIAEKIGKIDSKIGEESRVLSKYRDQKKGLMHDLLSGAVEVSVARINEAAPL